jgi:polar amino acid transport system permease protein
MSGYSFDFFYVLSSLPRLLQGLVVSLELTAIAVGIGTFSGFALALATSSRSRLLSTPPRLFVEIFRCTPALIQIVWFFYCFPMLANVFWSPFTMGVIALTLNLTAFNSEAYRAAIQAVPAAHRDASVALGLSRWHQTIYVVFPQVVRIASPVLVSNSISLFQQSSLVAIVSVEDLMYQGKLIAVQTYRPLETFTIVALIYFGLSFPISQVVGRIERRNTRLLA